MIDFYQRGVRAIQKKRESTNLIRIYIDNQKYSIPQGITIMHAYEYAGYRLIRGCGCRGGVCGACATVYRLPETNEIGTCLACQTIAQENMQVSLLKSFPIVKRIYNIEELGPEVSEIFKLYPALLNCMGCNTCTKSCPMDIEVMEAVSAILESDIEKAATLSISCVMCGLCAARCPAGLSPHLYFLLCQRIYGRHILVPFIHVPPRISEIETKKYDAELDKLMELDTEALKKIYQETQLDKKLI